MMVTTYYDLPWWYRAWFSLRMLWRPCELVQHILRYSGTSNTSGVVRYSDDHVFLEYVFRNICVRLAPDDIVVFRAHVDYSTYDGYSRTVGLHRHGQREKHLAVLCWRADSAERAHNYRDTVVDDNDLFPEYAPKEKR